MGVGFAPGTHSSVALHKSEVGIVDILMCTEPRFDNDSTRQNKTLGWTKRLNKALWLNLATAGNWI